MISVIIPAHNERAVIERGLKALLEGATPGELEVVVVANGCTDNTAEIVRAFDHPDVRVIETEIGSKTNALNLGDAAATCFPRFYVDADVVITLADIQKLAARLEEGDVLAVAPRFQMELYKASWAVRAFYDINGRLPSAREGIGGSGVYGLSENGRARFDEFPTLTADDGFVKSCFNPEERCTLSSCASIVSAPRTISGLISIKTRSHFGGYELRQMFPNLLADKGSGNGAALKLLILNPLLWLKLVTYGYVKVIARLRARRRLRAGRIHCWDRDDTSRQTIAHI